MKKIVLGVALAGGIGLMSPYSALTAAPPPPPKPGPGGDDVTICHVNPGGGRGRGRGAGGGTETITVKSRDVQKHLDHGDTLGPCGGGGNSGSDGT